MAAAPGMDQGRLHGVNVDPPALLCQGGIKLTMTSRSISRGTGQNDEFSQSIRIIIPLRRRILPNLKASNHNRYVVSDYVFPLQSIDN